MDEYFPPDVFPWITSLGDTLGSETTYDTNLPSTSGQVSFLWTEAPPPPAAGPWFVEGTIGPEVWYGATNQEMVQPAPMDFASTSGVAENVPGPSSSSSRVEWGIHTQYTQYVPESRPPRQDEYIEALQPMEPGYYSATSGGAPYSVTATLASASTFNTEEAPSQRDETPRGVLQLSQHFTNVERWAIDTHASRRQRRNLRQGQLIIAQEIAQQILEEINRCAGHGIPENERLECGSCYRKRSDGGRKTDWHYARRELNDLVLTSTTEGWVSRPDDDISKNMDRLPRDLMGNKEHLVNHMEAMLGRPHGETTRRYREPAPWGVQVTEAGDLIVFRDEMG